MKLSQPGITPADRAGETPASGSGQQSAPRRSGQTSMKVWLVVGLAAAVLAAAGSWAALTFSAKASSGSGGALGVGLGNQSTPLPKGSQKSPVNPQSPFAGLARVPTGRPAAAFSVPRLGGGPPVSLAAFRGKPVVLNFFASWCTDCRAELKAFGTVSSQARSKVSFVGIDTNDTASVRSIQALLASEGDHYPVGQDPNVAVASKYLVSGLPTTFFINADGRVVGQAFGAQTVKSLQGWVHRLEAR